MEPQEAPPQGGAFIPLFNSALSFLNGIGSVWIFALIILVNIDAFGRTLFAAPINGVPEMIELSIVGIVFLELGDAVRKGRLTRSDGLFNLLLERYPPVGRTLGVFFDLLSAVFMGLILYGSLPLLIESYEKDFYIGVEGLFTAPVWPVKLFIVIGCVMTLLQFLIFTWRHVRGEKAIVL